MSPPCSTFSPARCVPGGPGPIRGKEAPQIFGLPGITPADREKCRKGTLLAHRCADVADLCDEIGMPWAAEAPLIRKSFPSAFKLPRWLAIRARSSTKQADLEQC